MWRESSGWAPPVGRVLESVDWKSGSNPFVRNGVPIITSASGVQSVPLDHHEQILRERNVMRRWLRRWLREGVPSRQTGDVGSSMLWRIPPEELRAALAGKPPPRRNR